MVRNPFICLLSLYGQNIMESTNLHILGGGPAGLTTGYYAKKHGLRNFTLFEAGENVGGNCRTLKIRGVDCGGSFLQREDFRFDTGAHRFHDKDPQVTKEVKGLLGKDLLQVAAPSEIFFEGEFYRFPLLLSDLVQKLETKTLLRIALEKLYNRGGKQADNFAEFAINQYGRTLAERFLLNYSEKLWGQPSHKLSTAIAGNRLKGLDLWNFLRSTVLGTPQNPTHLDGSFFYPKYGIGMISDKLCEFIGAEHIKLNHRINRLIHKDGRIERIIVDNGAGEDNIEVPVSTVVNTLPLTLSMRMLEPPPPPEFRAVADRIKYIFYFVFFA